jgi:hypothetical protein
LAGAIKHVYTQTVADGTDTSVVRPSDWNSAHNYTLQDAASVVGTNTAGTLSNVSSGTLYLAGGPGVGLSQSGNTVSAYELPVNYLEPADWGDVANASVTTTYGLGALYLCPVNVPDGLACNQLNLIASVTFPTTSAGNTFSVSFTSSARSLGLTTAYSLFATHWADFYLFSAGAGGSSTDLVTVSSTAVPFATTQWQTWALSASAGAASQTASLSNSVSLSASFPGMTSGTLTSVNAATTVTTWGPGFTNWTSSASLSSSSSKTTGATMSFSVGSTWPAATAWASNKLVPIPWALTLAPGLYWLGLNRRTSTGSSSSSANANVSANQSYTATLNGSALTLTAQMTWAGFTASVINSLGVLGAGSAASLAPSPGHGTFSATYDPATTYYNNAGQQSGEVALSNVNTNVSLWKPWFQFASNRA